MSFVSVFMAVFSVIGAMDLLFGNRLGLGKEFEKGFVLLGQLALSMIGMIIIAPLIGQVIQPALDFLSRTLHLEPSVFPAMLLANDMGGAPLSDAVARDEMLGRFNGLVVSSMMGCTISFTIPVALDMVPKALHKNVLLGLLYGIITIPIGCFVSGIIMHIPLTALLRDLIPLLLFAGVIAVGLRFFPDTCIALFSVFGRIIKVLITIGLMLGTLRYLTGLQVIPGLDTYENGAMICFNAAAVMSGAFPFMRILSRLTAKPLSHLGERLGINTTSAFGFISSLATSLTTFESMKHMDAKGITLNAAFAVSAGFTFAGHLAFTLSYDAAYVYTVIVGKLISGFLALMVALLMTRHYGSNEGASQKAE